MDNMEYKGTTTIGLVCNEGVVLATEKRATMGILLQARMQRKSIRLMISWQ